jgi:hypothetical protein
VKLREVKVVSGDVPQTVHEISPDAAAAEVRVGLQVVDRAPVADQGVTEPGAPVGDRHDATLPATRRPKAACGTTR